LASHGRPIGWKGAGAQEVRGGRRGGAGGRHARYVPGRQGVELLEIENRRGLRESAEIEAGDELLDREELLSPRRRPPEQRQRVHQGLGRIAALPEPSEGGAALALAQGGS